jgi:hypothetical protein
MTNPEDGAEFPSGKQDTDHNGLSGRIASIVSDKYDPETLEIDHVAEKKLVRKLDLCIVPMVMLLYLLVRAPFSHPSRSPHSPNLHLPRIHILILSPSSTASTSATPASTA